MECIRGEQGRVGCSGSWVEVVLVGAGIGRSVVELWWVG